MNRIQTGAILLTLLCFFSASRITADSYFIKLSQNGLRERERLLSNEPLDDLKLQKVQAHSLFKPVLDHDPEPFQDWLIVDIPAGADSLLITLRAKGVTEFTEPVGTFRIHSFGEDSLRSKQWYLETIGVERAWQVTQGSEDVIVAIIDTGIDYLHPDLKNRIWINAAEDLNGNGRLDEYDINGVDDDGNGYIDDVIGWDFTDAPRFADGGDFRDPDNDPADEYPSGHGTQIAGIIAAEKDNGTGITGIAPGIRVMNLRAGTASGYLEEDDVASAIIYALENGARIINMSFGDVALSRFLRDVISYAGSRDAVIVASAGNQATDRVHYPSGLPEAISVGASNREDDRAGFSNFGSTVDLLAPGDDIFSTAPGNSYNSVNGTSFSAPIVSGTAALLLSRNPELSAEQIRNILKTSAQDILINGWDYWSGAGRLSAGGALRAVHGGVLQILHPAPNSAVSSGSLAIIGSALHPDLASFSIQYGTGGNPDEWTDIKRLSRRQILEDTLGVLNLQYMPDTTITLRLQMTLIDGNEDETHSTFLLDRTPPKIEGITIRPMIDGSRSSTLIEFSTDDITTAAIHLRGAAGNQSETLLRSGYETRNHRIKIDLEDFEGSFDFYIHAENAAGLESQADNNGAFFSFTNEDPFDWIDFYELPWSLPPGYMLDRPTDLDHDGRLEIVMSRYTNNGSFGPLEIYEFEEDRFQLRLTTAFTAIPRAAGDVDGDGLSDLLLGYGEKAFLLESSSPDAFPSAIVWQDSVQFWAAGYSDLDADGASELIGRVDSLYLLLENVSDNRFVEVARFSNPTAGENRYGVPKTALGDFNLDGRPDLVFGDSDGDFILYTADGNNAFRLLATGSADQTDATEMIVLNERGDLFVGSHTPDDRNYEHEFDARFWALEKFIPANSSVVRDAENAFTLYGYQSTRDFDSGLNLVKCNGRNALFAAFFPNLVLFLREDEYWKPVWNYYGAESNTVVAGDFTGNGTDEFFFNMGTGIIGFGTTPSDSPPAPRLVRAVPLDSTRVNVTWSASQSLFEVYRGMEPGEEASVGKVSGNFFSDSLLLPEQTYFYTVRAIDSGFTIPKGPLSLPDSVRTSRPPRLITAAIHNGFQAILQFNEAVRLEDARVQKRHSGEQSASVIALSDPQRVLTTFAESFREFRDDTLVVSGITDVNGVPLDLRYNQGIVRFEGEISEPYLQNIEISGRRRALLYFSEPMDTASIANPAHYRLEPAGKVTEIIITDKRHASVEIHFDEKSFVGGLGQASYLIMEGLRSRAGVPLRQTGKIHLFEPSEDLNRLVIYPQPVKPGHDHLVFANLPEEAAVSIFNINGRLIIKLEERTFFGGLRWDLRDRNGDGVPGGVYLYEIRHNDERKLGKVAVVR